MGFGKIACVSGLAVAAVAAPAQSGFDQIAITLLANYLGFPTNQITSLDSNYSIYDQAPAYIIAREVRQEPRTIWLARRNGRSWQQVSNQYGMPRSRYTALEREGYFRQDGRWVDWYGDYYRVPTSNIYKLRRQGVPLRDVLYATSISGRSRTPVSTVWTRYRTTRDWNRTATAYRVDVCRLPPPRKYTARRVWTSPRPVVAPRRVWVPPGQYKKDGGRQWLQKKGYSSNGTRAQRFVKVSPRTQSYKSKNAARPRTTTKRFTTSRPNGITTRRVTQTYRPKQKSKVSVRQTTTVRRKAGNRPTRMTVRKTTTSKPGVRRTTTTNRVRVVKQRAPRQKVSRTNHPSKKTHVRKVKTRKG